MSICKTCKKRNSCREICPRLKKEISGRGVSPRRKDKTYTVDFNLLERGETLNDFQLEVRRSAIRDTFLKAITGIDLRDLIEKNLTRKQKEAVSLLLKGYLQGEIAKKMKISQKVVNVHIKKAIRELKKYFFDRV